MPLSLSHGCTGNLTHESSRSNVLRALRKSYKKLTRNEGFQAMDYEIPGF